MRPECHTCVYLLTTLSFVCVLGLLARSTHPIAGDTGLAYTLPLSSYSCSFPFLVIPQHPLHIHSFPFLLPHFPPLNNHPLLPYFLLSPLPIRFPTSCAGRRCPQALWDKVPILQSRLSESCRRSSAVADDQRRKIPSLCRRTCICRMYWSPVYPLRWFS